MRFGPFRLEPSPLALYRGDQRIELPVQPMRLLALLANHSGQLVTHDDIAAELWAGRTVDFAGSVHVAIRQIRRALEDDARTPEFIETVPRRGYRFIARVRVTHHWHRHPVGIPVAAASVVAALLLLTGPPTINPAPVSENVRLGEYLLTRAEFDGYDRSLAYFDAELAMLPNSVRALAGAARAAVLLQDYDLADRHAARLLMLDPRQADALEIRGHVAMMRDRDLEAAHQDISQALAINPELAFAHHSMAILSLLREQPRLALQHIDTARRLDPASALIQADIGWIAYYAGDFQTAISHSENALTLNPEQDLFRYCIIRAASASNRADLALPHIARLMSAAHVAEPDRLGVLADGDPVQAFEQWRLARYLELQERQTVSPLLLATTAASARAYSAATHWLGIAIDTGDPNLVFAALDPVFEPVSASAELQQIRHAFGLENDVGFHITDRSGLSASPLR